MNKYRWLVVALAVSVTVNLIVLGFLAGHFYAGSKPRPMFDPALGVREHARFLSRERREELRPVFDEFRAVAKSLRRMRGIQHRLYEAAATEPFERERLQGVLAEFRGHLLASQEVSHAAVVELMQSLTPEERKQLLERMRKRLRHRPPDKTPRPAQ